MNLTQKEKTAEEIRSVAFSANEIKENLNLNQDINMAKTDALNLLYKSMNDNKHSWSLKDGYTKNEVDFALHNHGSHNELLDMDVTDIASHYVLLHFDAQNVPLDEYKLQIHGLIKNPMTFTLDNIKKFSKYNVQIVMECAGNDRTSTLPRFNHHNPWGLQAVGQAEWGGCLLMDVIKKCGGFSSGAVDVVFTGYDIGIEDGKVINYQRSLNIETDDILDDCYLIYEMNGQPLPKKHGFPLRLMVPGYYGMCSVKYLKHIDVIPYRFRGKAMVAYNYSIHPEDKELKQPVTIIRPRAIIRLPGISEFFTRNRYIQAGKINLEGRCWVGGSTVNRKVYTIDIAQVLLSFDNGETWNEAAITKKRTSAWGWNKWEYEWDAKPGLHTIIIRAIDTSGISQPVWPNIEFWDYRSMGTIAAQRITVHVLSELYVGLESVQLFDEKGPKPIDRRVY